MIAACRLRPLRDERGPQGIPKRRCRQLIRFSTGRRIGLSPHKHVVAGSSPASGSRCRSSSAVERVKFPVRFLSVGFLAGRRLWVIGHCRLAVQIRLRVSTRVAQFGRATVLSRSRLARFIAVRQHFNGPKTSGYLLLVRVQSGPPYTR
jgi:hypothetical protein